MTDLPDFLKSPTTLEKEKKVRDETQETKRNLELDRIKKLLQQVSFRDFMAKVQGFCLMSDDADSHRIIKIDLWRKIEEELKESSLELYQLMEREIYATSRRKK